eukprot:920860-Pleurochrysis_carterae.AAC.1
MAVSPLNARTRLSTYTPPPLYFQKLNRARKLSAAPAQAPVWPRRWLRRQAGSAAGVARRSETALPF